MSFKINSLFLTDGYKPSHFKMLAPGTTRLYGTWIPRSTKHAPKGITKIISFGQQLTWKWIHDEFEENFFFRNKIENELDEMNYTSSEKDEVRPSIQKKYKEKSLSFIKDMSLYLGTEYDGKHFEELWDLGYLPIKVKALPEGIETSPNIPHMTFINTVDGFAWLTLYLETIVSALAWKPATSASIALLYKRNTTKYVMETDPEQAFLIPFMCHDFSARGLDPWSMVSSGLGHATSFKGSDTLPVIPAARYFYNEPENEVCINSVNASEHSVSTTKIFTVGEQQMIADWLQLFPKGILSIVSDTFDLWKLITEYLPANKDAIMARDGKLVIRPDSGNPVDIICGDAWRVQGFTEGVLNKVGENGVVLNYTDNKYYKVKLNSNYEVIGEETTDVTPANKGVIELLWEVFGGTINEQGYKVLDPHIGAIYGDSITPARQLEMYQRLEAKKFAATNIVVGVGSFTYQYNTRDTLGFAAKGAWFEVETLAAGHKAIKIKKSYNIYKDPVTDDGTKKSLKGLLCVSQNTNGEYVVATECTWEEESQGLLQTIYEDGKFYNQQTLEQIRSRLCSV